MFVLFCVIHGGRPVQGTVPGCLRVQNRRRYRRAEQGRNRGYWKGRLRTAACGWPYSEQFEFGYTSEDSIGAIQECLPAQDSVGHVITPTTGMAWTIGEDALNQHLIKLSEPPANRSMTMRLFRAGIVP